MITKWYEIAIVFVIQWKEMFSAQGKRKLQQISSHSITKRAVAINFQ